MEAENIAQKCGFQQRSRDLSVNPKDTANFFSVLVFGWMGSLLTKGKKNTLENEDLFPLLKNSETNQLTESLNSEWRREIEVANQNRTSPRLWMVLLRLIPAKSYIQMICVFILKSTAFVAQPLTLGLFLRMLADPSRSVQSSVLYTLALTGVSTVKFLAVQNGDFMAEVWSMKLSAAITGLIYNKVRFSVANINY